MKSATVKTKDKPVEPQMGVSKNNKRKAGGAATSNVPPVTKPSRNSSTKKPKKARAKLPDVPMIEPLPAFKVLASSKILKMSKKSSGLSAAPTRTKKKIGAAGTSVGTGNTNVPPVTQPSSTSSSKRAKKSGAKSPNVTIPISHSARAPMQLSKVPAPSKPPKIPKTSSGLIGKPLPGSGAILKARSTVSTSRKRKADVAATVTIPPRSTGTSNNPTLQPNSSTLTPIANVCVVGSISNILSTFAGMNATCQSLSPLKSASAPGASESTATPLPLIIHGSSGARLPPLPPNWESRYIDTYNSSSIYQTFPVENKSLEFKAITGLLSPFKVTSAEQVINPELWQSFDERRKAMLKAKTDDLNLLKELGFGSDVVARNAKLSENFTKHHRLTTKYGQYSANQALLLHCTRDSANLEKIMVQGLDERLGSEVSKLGKGLYFSDDPEKCVQYDKTDGTILIFGVLLGDCLSVDNFSNVRSLVREPEKEAEQKRNRNDQFFDSITGRRKEKLHNEYVIFNRSQCYPFYVVKYQRGYKECTDGGQGDIFMSAREDMPIIAWKKLAGERVPMPKWPGSRTWPFYAASIFQSMGASNPAFALKDSGAPATEASDKINPTGNIVDLTTANGDNGKLCVKKLGRPVKRRKVADEECSICTNKFAAFCSNPSLWKELKCSHRLCSGCYKTIEVSRITVSGILCTSLRCPFCQGITGTAVGDCPDGLMDVSYIPSVCDGFGGHGSIKIKYIINSGTYQLNRSAYLPNSPEGNEILKLLNMAWERKLTFMIGTSMTTGRQNVLVWNIHHKTSQTGGVLKYGYPDDGYFARVRTELIAYGIE